MRGKNWVALGLLLSVFGTCQLVVARRPNQEAVVPVGEYSDMKIDANHCSGRALQIWKSGDKLYGLFLVCEGLAGDTPTGLLEETKWNPETSQLSFIAHLTIGSDVLESGKQVPSRDEFNFAGTLKENVAEGTLRSVDKAIAGAEPATINVRMSKRKSGMKGFASYRRWKMAADRVLAVRGPKW
jgi:hypothetical protein